VTFQTTLSAISQTAAGRKHSGLTSTQTSQARPEAWMKTLLQSPSPGSKLLNKITGEPTLRQSKAGGNLPALSC